MPEDLSYFIWNKGDIYFLNKEKTFSTKEFTCHCSFKECKEQKVSKLLIEQLTQLRKDVNEPITVTSGFRCSKYQEKLRSDGINTVVAKKSSHELGNAADITPTRMKIKDFLAFCEKKFKAIGIAKTFLHVDTRGQDDQRIRRWNY